MSPLSDPLSTFLPLFRKSVVKKGDTVAALEQAVSKVRKDRLLTRAAPKELHGEI
jgi:hypothetical protein